MSDYISKNDADFNVWQGNLVAIIEPNLIAWSINADDFAALKSGQRVWQIAYAKASNKLNRTSADVATKDEANRQYKRIIRGFVSQWLAYNSKLTDADRTRMGLTVKTGTRTPTPVPATSPVGIVDFSMRLQHSISYYDEASAHSNAKPAGVHGCEIFMKVDGEAPKEVSELTYVATNTASPCVVKFDGNKVGKTVYYWLRWVNMRGEAGPWSVTVSATIAG